jgi:cell division protease FtsH
MDKKNKKTNKANDKKHEEQWKKEIEEISLDVIKSIKKSKKLSVNKRNTNIDNRMNVKKRLYSFRVNPFVLLGVILMFLFFASSFITNFTFSPKGSLDSVISGVEDNNFSQILIQNDSKVIAVGKLFITAKYEEQVTDLDSLNEESNLEFISKEDLINELKPKSLAERIKELFDNPNSDIKEIFVWKDYVVITRGEGYKDQIIKDVSFDEFNDLLDEYNLTFDSLGFPVYNLQKYAKEVDTKSFLNRLSSEQFSSIYQIGDYFIAKKKDSYVQKVVIDWTPNIDSFVQTLQNEEISLSEANVDIVSVNIPSGISLDDIFTLITIAGMVILVIVIYRSAQSSGMGLMQFGQSKAKMFFGQKTDVSFKDVAGIDEARDELNEIVEFLRHPNKFRNLGARIPKGILMFGPPGTGKTLLARAIAGEAKVPFFHTSGSEFEEMLVGAGASRVRDLFAKAKRAAPSLIFIDEIDAVARKRGTRIQSGSTEQTLNQILVEMDGFEKNTNVIVIAATNRPDVLDPAILRPGRFDRQVRIELPDVDGRFEILRIHSKNKPLAKEVDLKKIARRTVGFTGADLENIMNEAAIIAAKQNKKDISMEDIEEAVSKVVLGPAKRSRKRSEDELKLVAYHEAGHAVVSYFTPNSTPVDKISIISRGGTGGVTMFLPEKDESIVSKKKLLAEIAVSLGGRAAEEIALEDVSTGASNDIKKATKIARRMIQQFGMNEKLGLVEYGDHEENGLGYQYGDFKDYSEKTAEIIDEEVRKMVSQQYAYAKKILTTNRKKLDKLANKLLEREVIDRDEFRKLMQE